MRYILAGIAAAAVAVGAICSAPTLAQQPAGAAQDQPAKLEPGRLGIELRDLSQPTIKALGLAQPHAVLAVLLAPDSPAERAGLRPGDVIVELEGAPVGAVADFAAAVQRIGAGKTAALGILRKNERLTLRPTLARSDTPQEVPQEANERRIAAHEAILSIFDREKFPQEWAEAQVGLGLAYRRRTRGHPPDNKEKEVAAFEAALTVYTHQATPQAWAYAHLDLGTAYSGLRVHRDNNREKAIDAYVAALTVLTRQADPQAWARAQHNLGLAYEDRNVGDKADNIEKAISAYQAALTGYTHETNPQQWARASESLGYVLERRILGDKAENIEQAIAAYVAAAALVSRETGASIWVRAQLGLASAYRNRIRGDRADNIEQAIAAYEAALTVHTRQASPIDHVLTQILLADAYRQRLLGKHAENLDKSIAALETALTVGPQEATPEDWARTQISLALAYQGRISGNQAQNQEKAISAIEAALTIYLRDTHPRDWARTQSMLGSAYAGRILGEAADNCEKEIAALEAALTVLTIKTDPLYWRQAQSGLADAFARRVYGNRAKNLETAIGANQSVLAASTREGNSDSRDAMPNTRGASSNSWASAQVALGDAHLNLARIHGDRGENVEKAITALEAALTVYTREAEPRRWASTLNILATAYQQRVHGDRADNIDKSIAAVEATFAVFTRQTAPSEWAGAQSLLALGYRYQTRGDPKQNFDKAIAAFEAALSVETADGFPRQHLLTASTLGITLSAAQQWHKADPVYAGARIAFLRLYGEGLNDIDARDLIARAGPLFAEAAFVAAEVGDLQRALALAGEGRGRQLRVALRRQGIDMPADKRPRYDALTAELRGWERVAAAANSQDVAAKVTDTVAVLNTIAGLRWQLGELTAPHLPKEVGLTPELIPEGGAIVVPIVTDFGGKLLVVTKNNGTPAIASVALPRMSETALDKMMKGDNAKGGWLAAYKAQSTRGQQAQWLEAIEALGPHLWDLFGAAMDQALHDRGVKPGARIVMMPTAALGLLPLGLARDPASGRRLGETYELVQAPSFDALAAASAQLAKPPAPSLAAAINPTGDLAFTEIESAFIAAHFAGKPLLKLDASVATPALVVEALRGKSYWHFASHGEFDWDDARRSGLVMRGRERLTIGRLLENQDSLGRPRLVVLSACETGLYDIDRNPDEFVGLPATFMQIGAAGVLGSLWLVDDLATSLLMAKFYDLHMGSGVAPPTALRQAQAWVREASRAEILVYVKAAGAKAKVDPTKLAQLNSALTRGTRSAGSRFAGIWEILQKMAEPAGQAKGKRPPDMNARPFQHPYYWAGFVYTGL